MVSYTLEDLGFLALSIGVSSVLNRNYVTVVV